MKTYTPKKSEIIKKWYLIDAKDEILGKVAVLAADTLRGKKKTYFSPNLDCGDYVVIINAKKVAVSGNKMKDKIYYTHSWYPGGLKEKTLEEAMEKDPCFALKNAIYGMLPKNKLGREIAQKLKIFADEQHDHTAQQPIKMNLK